MTQPARTRKIPRLSPIALLLGSILQTAAYAERVIVVNASTDDVVNVHCTVAH